MNRTENSEQSGASKGWAWSVARRQLYSIVGTTALVLGFYTPWAEMSFGPTGNRFIAMLGSIVGRGEASNRTGFLLDAGEISQHRGWVILWLGVAAGLMALVSGDRITRFLRPFRCTALLVGFALLCLMFFQIANDYGALRTGYYLTLLAYGLLGFGLILDLIKNPKSEI